jgi:hypothetical protein
LISWADWIAPAPNELGDEYKFKDPEPPKRKSRLAQLGIELPEKKVFSEEEQKKVDELVSEFSFFLDGKAPGRPLERSRFWKCFLREEGAISGGESKMFPPFYF